MTPAKNTICLWYDRDAEGAARFCADHAVAHEERLQRYRHAHSGSTIDAFQLQRTAILPWHPGRVYLVEPTGSFMDDPNLTDRNYPGNPTRSYRSADPLRVVGEYPDWQEHASDVIQAMKDRIAGLEPIDD